jgi:hypothetical protein
MNVEKSAVAHDTNLADEGQYSPRGMDKGCTWITYEPMADDTDVTAYFGEMIAHLVDDLHKTS